VVPFIKDGLAYKPVQQPKYWFSQDYCIITAAIARYESAADGQRIALQEPWMLVG